MLVRHVLAPRLLAWVTQEARNMSGDLREMGFEERGRARPKGGSPRSLTSRVEAEACHHRLGLGTVSDTATLERARTALDEHAWSEAYAALSWLDHEGDLGGADLERLGEAAWWNAHPRESLDAFARAYAAYVAEGDPARAAFVALRLAFEHFETRDVAQWNGWMGRATRLLEDQPESAVHGYLELQRIRGFILLGQGSSDEPAQLLARILEIGRRYGDRDLEAFGLVLQGWLLVMGAQVEQGLALVDEAAVAAVEGELTPHTAGAVYCITIGVCRTVADYRRASEWTEAATRWCERESVSGFPGICRIHRAEIMRLRGAFSDAESEAREALAQLTAFGMSSSAGWGYNEIGEIRLRLGDLEGAEEAFERAHQLGRDAQPGIALLHLARGRIGAARASIATALSDAEAPLVRARLLPSRVEIALAAHDLADAREAADELGGIARTYDQPVLHAAAYQALGAALTYEEDAAAAITELRRAVRHWTEARAVRGGAGPSLARRRLSVGRRRGGGGARAADGDDRVRGAGRRARGRAVRGDAPCRGRRPGGAPGHPHVHVHRHRGLHRAGALDG